MKQDEIIEMAMKSGCPKENALANMDILQDFAKLVADKEREACAKLVEDSWMAFSRASNVRLDITPFPELSYVAKVIRARGEA